MQIKWLAVNVLFFFLLVVLLLSSLWLQDEYLWFSFAVILLSILYLFFRFERRKVDARELVLLAVLAAIAAVGRVPFAGIPSVQPTTFVIMMSGYVFGAESGFMIGAIAALASNMILGQGPWTPWQMAAWGLVGFTSGALRHTAFLRSFWGRVVFGFLWGFLFGWIMNIWGFFSYSPSANAITLHALIIYFAGSATFDFMHSMSNVIFLLLFGNIWIKNLSRFQRKYGLLE